jgi:cold-inducible RNA-binding protein
MRISVGNISQTLTEEDLKKLFSEYGDVEEVIIKRDKKTKTSLGYGHVDMTKEEQAKIAIEKLNGKEIEGKALAVVSADQLQNEHKDKNWDKSQSNANKIQGNKVSGGGFGGVTTPRRSGGGGRGK